MDIKQYILEIIKDERTQNEYLKGFNIPGLSDDQKIYLLAKMLREINEREDDVKKFSENFDRIYCSQSPVRETILLCHMAIEHFIDEYLSILLPNNFDIKEKPRFSFDEKLYLCVASNSGIGFFYNEIKLINKIRNKFAHNPKYDVLDSDLKILITNNWIAHVVPDIESVEEKSLIIERSCRAICSIIHGVICETLRGNRDLTFPSYKHFI